VVIQELHSSNNIKSRSSIAAATTSYLQTQTLAKANKPLVDNRGGRRMTINITSNLQQLQHGIKTRGKYPTHSLICIIWSRVVKVKRYLLYKWEGGKNKILQ